MNFEGPWFKPKDWGTYFQFYFIQMNLNGHQWLAATVPESIGPQIVFSPCTHSPRAYCAPGIPWSSMHGRYLPPVTQGGTLSSERESTCTLFNIQQPLSQGMNEYVEFFTPKPRLELIQQPLPLQCNFWIRPGTGKRPMDDNIPTCCLREDNSSLRY